VDSGAHSEVCGGLDGAEGADFLGYKALLLTTVGAAVWWRRAADCAVLRPLTLTITSWWPQGGGGCEPPVLVISIWMRIPEVEVQVGGDVFTAKGPHGRGPGQAAAVWQRMVETFPVYAEYQERTTRLLPVVILRRTG